MQQFSKQIMVGEESRTFHFTRMQNVNGVKFFITSHNELKKPMSFSLRQTSKTEWKLFPGAARWLYAIESELSDAIVNTRQ